jgi:ankyrin repeat protein
LKAKVIEDSDGAFQARLFDQLGNVQDSLKQSLDEIHTFASTAKELAQSQTDILRELQELKASVKPKTRWDWAKQDFDKYRKMLDPLPEVPSILRSLLDKRHPGTTQWVFESNKYMAWGDSHGSALLCLTGLEAAGKSVVLASANENIRNTIDDTSAAICFVSCKTGDGNSNDMGTNPVEKIQRSLMYQVYRHAAEDEDKPDLLEECNKLFHHPKAKKQQQSLMNGADDESLPGFGECVTKMARILHKDVIFLVDAIDCLTSNDQKTLFVAFGDVIDRSTHDQESKVSVRVLTTCRSSGSFAVRAFAKDSAIDIAGGNSQDMASYLLSAIERMPDWTAEERSEAQAEVLNMAGSRFGYISDIAIPFLRQPFQRPLSRRLKALPQGITDSYKQAIRGMPSNYLDLLRTALTWTLYSAQPVRVKEVVESFSGVYDGLRTGDVLDGYSGVMATELELLQLQGASGPFLKIAPNAAKQQIVTCQDLAQIRKFCEHTDEGTGNPAADEHCARCQANTSSAPSLELNEKQIHLDLALTLVRHLNNPTFQKRFGLLPRKVSKDVPTNATQSSEDEGYESTNSPVAQHIDAVAGAEKERDLTGNNRKDDISNDGTDTVDEFKSGDANDEPEVAKAAIAEDPSGDGDTKNADGEDGYDSDDSKEDEDYGEVDIIRKLRGQENEDEEDAPDGSDLFRYEINQWQHHFREADRLWSGEEKASSQHWAELIAELDKFAFENEPAFEAWQYKWDDGGGYLEKGVGALHVAAYLGLTYWVEHLVKALGKDPNEFSGGRNALQAAAIEADNRDSREMLRLLLTLPGADATVRGTSDPTPERSALQDWLLYDPSEEVVKLLVDSGVDFNTMYDETQDTALHFFAAGKATDPAALNLILDSGVTEERSRPDINAKNTTGDTPLHFLMMRRDVPVELLKTFIANGADINAENGSSLRPLQSACSWSEPGIVSILLENGIEDVDDGDDSGITALHTSAFVGSTECVRLLLAHGADMSRKAKTGRGPLHFAARNGHKDTVEALIELGADHNISDAHAHTPFWFACDSVSKETAATLLVALKPKFSIAEINLPSRSGRTPLRLAATHGFSEICEELISMTTAAGLDTKAMLDIQDTAKGLTAMHRAAWWGELACVRLLLDNKADATLKDSEGNSALMLATTQWQMSGEAAFEEIVFLLIDKDQEQAKVNSELPATAASNGSVRVLEKLYRIGADVNKPDVYGWTPLTLAQRLQKPEVERFLKQQTAWGGTLPSSWIPHSAIKEIVLLSEDGLEIAHVSGTQCTISTDKPLPAGLDRYYFEVTSACQSNHGYRFLYFRCSVLPVSRLGAEAQHSFGTIMGVSRRRRRHIRRTFYFEPVIGRAIRSRRHDWLWC